MTLQIWFLEFFLMNSKKVSMNLNREFEMARREAVTYLERKDQKTEIKKTKDNMQWSINLLPKKLPHDQINKVCRRSDS